jgi:hypothetical protein
VLDSTSHPYPIDTCRPPPDLWSSCPLLAACVQSITGERDTPAQWIFTGAKDWTLESRPFFEARMLGATTVSCSSRTTWQWPLVFEVPPARSLGFHLQMRAPVMYPETRLHEGLPASAMVPYRRCRCARPTSAFFATYATPHPPQDTHLLVTCILQALVECVRSLGPRTHCIR